MGETHDIVDAVVYLEQAPFVAGEVLGWRGILRWWRPVR
jgi:hypothetical protein